MLWLCRFSQLPFLCLKIYLEILKWEVEQHREVTSIEGGGQLPQSLLSDRFTILCLKHSLKLTILHDPLTRDQPASAFGGALIWIQHHVENFGFLTEEGMALLFSRMEQYLWIICTNGCSSDTSTVIAAATVTKLITQHNSVRIT